MDYQDFLQNKIKLDTRMGFDVPVDQIDSRLFPHQRDIAKWAIRGGRRAIFASFGLGKTFIQLEVMRQIQGKEGGRQLIIMPLGVRQEFKQDAAKLDIAMTFVRWTQDLAGDGLYITNYESIRDGRLDPNQFNAVSLDEASVLRSYGSKTFQEFLTLFEQVKYRFVATATPSPNRFKELIHYAGFLGIMDTGQALTRFFQRDSQKANNLTLYPHKELEFWLWVSSWAVFLQKPSDLCRRSLCQKEKNLKANDSEGSLLSNGKQERCEMAHGFACATAENRSSQHQATYSGALSKAADASGQSMGVKEQGSIMSGGQCLTDAITQTTKTMHSTEAEGFPSVKDGKAFRISEMTRENPQSGKASIESTTTKTMSPAIADGQRAKSRRKTGVPEQTTQPDSATCTEDSCDKCPLDEGYELPELHVHYHEVNVDSGFPTGKDGQMGLFNDAAMSLQAASKEKRISMPARIVKMMEILQADPESHYILWHDQEAERHAIKKALPQACEVYGSLDLETREQRIIDFSEGRFQYLATKPVLSGSGCNFQRYCHKSIFLGIGFKFNDFIQSIHRIYRFLQTKECHIHLIYSSSERRILEVLEEKWRNHERMVAEMTKLIKQYGLSSTEMESELRRSIGVERVEAIGDKFTAVNNDCVDECKRINDNSVDLIHTSIPFSNHYEYTPSYNDFGHTDGNRHFWEQMDFLTPELFRALKPGRIYACHVKDRVLFGNVTGKGAPTISPFHMEATFHAMQHGFDYMGMITVVTDVVRENNQTYRLGWSEQCKDGTKMGCGSPEYIVLMRKPQSDRSRGYADEPVQKDKAEYSRSRWQIDAHAFWRSSGDRQLKAEEMAGYAPETLYRAFRKYDSNNLYDYDFHVRLGERLDAKGSLPATFMSLAPVSHHPDVWTDVNRMRTLNSEQTRKKLNNHICPLQFDIVDRIVTRYSQPGELVLDPFAGIMTVPLRAIKLGRCGYGIELNPDYFTDGLKYLKIEEQNMNAPTLFDIEREAVNT